MSFLDKHIDTAEKFIQKFDGRSPFHLYLKQYFKQEKKHGSKDRKQISHVCYAVLRLGKSFLQLSFKSQFQIAHFIQHEEPGIWSFLYEKTWIEGWSKVLEERIKFIQSIHHGFNVSSVFPIANISGLINNKEAFIQSHLYQPNVFIRLRPGCHGRVEAALSKKIISFQYIHENTILLPPSVDLSEVEGLNNAFVIQDISSQQTAKCIDYVAQHFPNHKPIKFWDCCAASGGKTLLAFDRLKHMDITVTDIRSAMLNNLHNRFKAAGILSYNHSTIDLTKPPFRLPHKKYDCIICDAPCTGSGTWSRTPEQLRYFNEDAISDYTKLQHTILQNIIPFLAPKGYLLYITCSVFKEENEDQIAASLNDYDISILASEYFEGAAYKGDTMYACLLQLHN